MNLHRITRHFLMPFVLVVTTISVINANDRIVAQPDPAIEGRWDITIDVDGKQSPSWLEIRHSGSKRLIGHFVGITGSARPISIVNFKDGKLSFSIPPQWEEEDNDLSVEGTLDGDNLSGSITLPNGKKYNWSAVRAPSLRRAKAPVWGTPVKIFSGKDIKGWKALGDNQWIAEAGVLKSPKSGANLMTEKAFSDFKLHIEFRYPKGSNSGVYLRGRYEVQVMDSKGSEPLKDNFGGVYGFIAASEMAAKDAGQWQSYDITLIGRMVSVVANGKQIICNQEIPGITGGALDSNEGEPGPLLIQGDHGPVEYRNIILTPAK